MKEIRFVFFGTSEVSVGTLEVLKAHGLIPTLIVSAEDKLKGRGMVLSPTPSKIWASIHHVPIIQPITLTGEEIKKTLAKENPSIFIVVDYGKLIPKNIFEFPPHKTLNVHYSLLPKWRGASPIHATILYDNEAWVSIMEIAEKLDQGGIIAQEKLNISEWPPKFTILRELMIKHGAELLIKILPEWISGSIKPTIQDEGKATYTKKILKTDADITNDSAETALRKIRAFEIRPRARLGDLIITEAHLESDKLIIDRVIPPGKKEMDYKDYLRGNPKIIF